MLSENFPTHIHWVSAKDGIFLFRGLSLLREHGNTLYNQALKTDDKALAEAATKLIVETDEVIHRQFDSYTVDHLSQPVISIPQNSAK